MPSHWYQILTAPPEEVERVDQRELRAYDDYRQAAGRMDCDHWMQENGRYFLMKGEYKPHPGAVAKAKFKLVSHGK